MMAMSIVDLLTNGYGKYPSGYVLIFGWGSVAVALIASLVFTLIPWKHRPVDARATVAEILDRDNDETPVTEGDAQ